ncbi:MAG: hypothetical protein K0S34_1319 [Bacillales bacterium]|nr:hypothetical protein [Bacillales bacterium]
MKKYLIKCFLLTFVMFFGVLFGMQMASEGINKTRGIKDDKFKPAFLVSKGDNEGVVKADVLGSKVTSEDLLKKQKELEEIKAFNFFSEVGNFISDSIDTAANFLLEKIFGNS